MEKERKIYLVKIAEKLSSDAEEKEILQYGLHQGFIIIWNVLTLIICGIIWKELPFMILLFLSIFFLRPYAGGYHADTELSCYLISTLIMNAAVWGKKVIILSNTIFICAWIGMAAFIWICAPVENPIHCLDDKERKKYAANTKKILLCYALVMLMGIWSQRQYLTDAILWSHVLIVIAMAAGLWKYKLY